MIFRAVKPLSLGLPFFIMAAPVQAQFGREIDPLPPWMILCPRAINDARAALDRDYNALASENEKLRVALASLLREFDDIKAMTLTEATKDAGKIRLLPPFPAAEATPTIPQFPRLEQLRCSRRTPREYAVVRNRLPRADTVREEKAKVLQELADLKSTYEEFKAITADL